MKNIKTTKPKNVSAHAWAKHHRLTAKLFGGRSSY